MPSTFEQAKDEIARLVKHFAANHEAYRAPAYKEAHARQEFIDPFFAALGWDVHNTQQLAPDYREVVIEDTVEIQGQKKAPDYVFRVGRDRKFFAEAKKPGVDLKKDSGPAYQLRRYAWTAKLPLSLLTDFEELAVYDCRTRPFDDDKASAGRVNYFAFEEYPDRWREIWDVFSREAVWGGSFDQYAQAGRGKRGTSEVDAEFLKEIESWRDALARNMAVRNPRLTIDELNDAVQRTIDRIIFLRMAEDRGIEDYGRLSRLADGEDIYKGLVALFRHADARYNSGLFDFSRKGDQLTPGLKADDRVLKPILTSLYFPQSPYEFSVLPVEILGNVYEQFLGKVIRLTAAHQAKVEEKPEVKKAGGVYYTPAYIVAYIVKNTVGVAVAGKSPQQLKGFRVLDPACGSGSFLLGAYQCLLDYYLNWYMTHEPEKHPKAVWQLAISHPPSAIGQWRLTTAEKKRILLEHIFGVDIDRQAVEVTKLSLLLKVLETESDESLGRQLALFHEEAKERALPNLDRNIKCGNSLIGPDYFSGQLIPDDDELERVNPFDWAKEFPEAMRAGGFDCVIGNPPYGADYTPEEKTNFQSHYVYKKGKPETYIFFFERGLELLVNAGMLGYITPNAWLTNYYGVQLRHHLLENSSFKCLVDLEPTKVFQKAVVDTVITILAKERTSANQEKKTEVWRGTKDYRIIYQFEASPSTWEADTEAIINLQADPRESILLARLEHSNVTLGNLVEYSQGVIPYNTKADGQANLYIAAKPRNKTWLPLIESASQVRRYEVDKPTAFIHYGPQLWCAREPRFFSQPKILFHRLRKKLPKQLVGGFDDSGVVNRHSLSNLIARPDTPGNTLLAVLGLFNSTLTNWWFVKRYGLLMEIGGFKVARFPLPINWNDSHNRIVPLVEAMLDLHKGLAAARDTGERERLQRLIDSTDQQIDTLVYELYGLTLEEIAIVEGKAGQNQTTLR